ncbi:alpha-ketoglutarate-dependent dioxygenase AlkB [Maricaulis sp. D1M11]|uniref:alpha-ketoglutarate-dependent dioxygenase AlkB n=1 Tax=Maricaulis sp. D1M11 TaxID=3076117 RepID=UPI0039B6DE16
MTNRDEMIAGFRVLPGYFDREAQAQLLAHVRNVQAMTPFWRPTMPRTGKPLSVKMTNFGSLGWMTDKAGGYRYVTHHPETGAPWQVIPEPLMALWEAHADYPAVPEACLVNWYAPDSRMGMHVDWDEAATDAAVISVSLGDKARFRLGNHTRGGTTQSMILSSGDVVVLGGASRRCYHGVDRIYPGTSTLLDETSFPGGGRINLTLRRVTIPSAPKPC